MPTTSWSLYRPLLKLIYLLLFTKLLYDFTSHQNKLQLDTNLKYFHMSNVNTILQFYAKHVGVLT